MPSQNKSSRAISKTKTDEVRLPLNLTTMPRITVAQLGGLSRGNCAMNISSGDCNSSFGPNSTSSMPEYSVPAIGIPPKFTDKSLVGTNSIYIREKRAPSSGTGDISLNESVTGPNKTSRKGNTNNDREDRFTTSTPVDHTKRQVPERQSNSDKLQKQISDLLSLIHI